MPRFCFNKLHLLLTYRLAPHGGHGIIVWHRNCPCLLGDFYRLRVRRVRQAWEGTWPQLHSTSWFPPLLSWRGSLIRMTRSPADLSNLCLEFSSLYWLHWIRLDRALPECCLAGAKLKMETKARGGTTWTSTEGVKSSVAGWLSWCKELQISFGSLEPCWYISWIKSAQELVKHEIKWERKWLWSMRTPMHLMLHVTMAFTRTLRWWLGYVCVIGSYALYTSWNM